MSYPAIILLLWVAYLALTMSFTTSNLVLGLVLSVGVTLLLQPRMRRMRLTRLPVATAALLAYVAVLAVDIIRNGLMVARIVLMPKMPVRQGIIAVPSETRSDLATAMSAHAITVTPGELVVEIGTDRVLYVHCLVTPHDEQELIRAQRRRKKLLDLIAT